MFKVGDNVKIISTIYSSDELQAGNTGTVVPNETSNPFCVIVEMHSGYKDILGRDWAFFPDELEVIA